MNYSNRRNNISWTEIPEKNMETTRRHSFDDVKIAFVFRLAYV